MYKNTALILLVIVTFQNVKAQSNWRNPMVDRPVVIIKADDYITPSNWQTFFNLIESNDICASVGVIAGWAASPEGISGIQEKQAIYYTNEVGDYVHRYEFWNHGYEHEGFAGQSQAAQTGILKTAQDIFINSFGFQSRAFGPPGNGLDQNTRFALDQYNSENDDQLKIWMSYRINFDAIDISGWSHLDSFAYGRNFSHVIYTMGYADAATDYQLDADAFIARYNSTMPDIMLIEMHPAGYADSSVVALANVITFLKAKNAMFVTPSYLYQKANVERYCGDYYGTSSVVAPNSISAGAAFSDDCDHTIVHNGATVDFIASQIVYLKPGFSSFTGSTFTASISTPSGSNENGRLSGAPETVKTDAKEGEVTLYPNPTNGMFVVHMVTNPTSDVFIKIRTLKGITIREINNPSINETIDLSSYPDGLYLVFISSGDKHKTFKVVKY